MYGLYDLAHIICEAANAGDKEAQEFVVDNFDSTITSPKVAREATAPLREAMARR